MIDKDKIIIGASLVFLALLALVSILQLTSYKPSNFLSYLSNRENTVVVQPPVLEKTPDKSAPRILTGGEPVVQKLLPILIAEVLPGVEGNVDYEYIKLYNPHSEAVHLTGWKIMKKSSGGSESTLVSKKRLEGKIITANSYFIIADEKATGIAVDAVWPASYSIAQKNNSIILYNRNNEAVDSAVWVEIPLGKTYTRN